MAKTNISATDGETERDYAPLPVITADNITDIKSAEPIYTVSELSAAARTKFGTLPEVVAAAFKAAGKEKATLNEAAAVVKAFLEREVK